MSIGCFVYRKGTIFQANHNGIPLLSSVKRLFCIPQRYDFSSKSQLSTMWIFRRKCCFVYRKGTIFQANHNSWRQGHERKQVVLYTAKVRFFKQITTDAKLRYLRQPLFCIPQRYDFSSKSQRCVGRAFCACSCFVYRKGTIFQANHNQSRELC